MLFADAARPLDDQHWRRINMRKVAHLIGAEMIHNLYDRHWPRINSLRFRHTITNFQDGIVESYAPVREWDYLQRWLSERFRALDPVLLREIEAIMDPTYALVDEVIQRVDSANLPGLTNQELALLLIDIMDFPLGDIYKLNVVQIEYGLNFALHVLLAHYEPNAVDRNDLLSRLISPTQLTVAQEEEVAFGHILAQGYERDIADPAADHALLDALEGHHRRYAPTHCAYGEEPPTLDDYINKYRFLFSRTTAVITLADAQANAHRLHSQSRALLAKLNDPKLTELCGLMARIGVFRDRNKAKLGETVTRRLRLLDEIARRTQVEREDLNFYLMAELTALLDLGEAVPAAVLAGRKHQGVRFERSEGLMPGVVQLATTSHEPASDVLRGICASQGRVAGKVKIVHAKEDIAKVEAGDIMVAIGTDFDLIEIMTIAGGIITEEGGLLSHASVVSRELKKPCLIGVARATVLLQDGDELELDATESKAIITNRTTA